MRMREVRITIATSAGGAFTSAIAESAVNGYLYAIETVGGTLDAGTDWTFTVTQTSSGVDMTLLTLTDSNANAMYYPRVAVHGNTGTALTATAGGDRTLQYCSGLPKLVIAQGGATKAGVAILYFLGV